MVMFSDGEFEHEVEIDLCEVLPQAVDRMKITVVLNEDDREL